MAIVVYLRKKLYLCTIKPTSMNFLIYIVLGIIIGIAIALLVAAYALRREKQLNAQLLSEIEHLRDKYEHAIRKETATAAQLTSTQQTLDYMQQQRQKDAETQQQNLQTELALARECMRAQFEKEMLARTEQLKQSNAEHLEQVVNPLKRELDLLRELVAQSKESSDKNTASLSQSIRTIIEHDQQRDKTTQTLANALKNRGKVQGDWGEQVLTNILRDSGLREGEEYMVQDNVKDDTGKNLRPDVVVRGADGTRIIIDSKVSLSAYSDYVGAEDEEQRKIAIKANYESIWKHVEELSKKNYAAIVDKAAPIVLMFVPNEGSYILAMNHDPSLGSRAYQKGVIIINPTNLVVVLHLI